MRLTVDTRYHTWVFEVTHGRAEVAEPEDAEPPVTRDVYIGHERHETPTVGFQRSEDG